MTPPLLLYHMVDVHIIVVCKGGGCVCLTATEQDKLKNGLLKVTDLI